MIRPSKGAPGGFAAVLEAKSREIMSAMISPSKDGGFAAVLEAKSDSPNFNLLHMIFHE